MSLPVVELSGAPYEQGVAHGRALAERVHNNLRVYFERFEKEARLPREEVLARTRRYLAALQGQSEEYVQGMRGIADGAGAPLDDIAALNLRYELLYHEYKFTKTSGAGPAGSGGKGTAAGGGKGAGRRTDGCTSFALLPEATEPGHLIMGQNWDWIPQVKGALLRVTEPDGLRVLGYTEAGIFGVKIGLNTAGVGLAVNGLLSMDDDWSRLRPPYHLRTHRILRARDFAEAFAVVTDDPPSCSTNYLIGRAPEQVADLEHAPEDAVGVIAAEDGVLVHANHFEDPEAIGVTPVDTPALPKSRHRAERLRARLAGAKPLSIAGVMDCLCDHDGRPNSVCRHPDTALPGSDRVETVTSVIMDLEEGRLWATEGPPCANDYQELSL
ncbi:MAG: peptidase C45 [Candidatus Krumholzibacteriota bacterium]|nr:peptidase C45 [Candidatus Krumholzibacteriota bacterium]